MTENRQPKFKSGDLVRHRASGERAVVVDHNTRCKTHGMQPGMSGACFLGQGCVREFDGTYCLSVGLADDVVKWVHEYLLEAIPVPGYEPGTIEFMGG